MANISLIQITEEALRAMANLNANNDPNWLEIKNYLSQVKETMKNMCAFGINITSDNLRFFQGVATALNDLSIFAEDPKTAIEKIHASKERPNRKLEGLS